MDQVGLRKWDVVEHLKSDEDMALYFEACLEEGDPALMVAALGGIARARGMSQLAQDAGLSADDLCGALSGQGHPEFSTVIKIIEALGLKLR